MTTKEASIFRWRCPELGTLLTSKEGCERRREMAQRKHSRRPGGISLDACRRCPGPERLAEPQPADGAAA